VLYPAFGTTLTRAVSRWRHGSQQICEEQHRALAALGDGDVLDLAWNGMVPAGHRGSAPGRSPADRLGPVEGL